MKKPFTKMKGAVNMNQMENIMNSWKLRGVKKSDIEAAILRIQKKRENVEPGTEEWRRLSVDLEQELKNKKMYNEAKKLGLKWDTVAIIVMVLAISGFAFALDLESPKALKIASYVLKLPGVKI